MTSLSLGDSLKSNCDALVIGRVSGSSDVHGHENATAKHHSKAPSWLTTFAPVDALVMQEEAWNAYPRCRSGLCFLLEINALFLSPYFSKFFMSIDTIHKADNGCSENVHGLSEDQLAVRQVEVIDIASAATDYWSYIVGRNNVDLSNFHSARSGRGPLLEDWQDHCSPVMTAYKLVTVDAPYWGFGSRLEQALMAGERSLFLESHRNCFAWIDEWFGLTVEVLRELEQQSDYSLNKNRIHGMGRNRRLLVYFEALPLDCSKDTYAVSLYMKRWGSSKVLFSANVFSDGLHPLPPTLSWELRGRDTKKLWAEPDFIQLQYINLADLKD
ncbi:hypothetical protein CQW23_14353 [Capsicum baccatum]|uniref:Phosphatidylinositol transfer protein N-terminal domain-containing protein n=1 Tax=Capsicum baccatum TaxID=33114 RepID=A0A2G2WIX4_CAPBA|nr:hypothetical protein CQW23_14353 [Capsicum baccatum]